MSIYPSAVKNFLALTDGVDKILAAHPNDRADEITAIQTFIGASGASQSHNVDILTLFSSLYIGGRIYWKSNTEIYVDPICAVISNNTGSLKKLRISTSVSTLTASDLDTGSMAVGFYYIYATADTATTLPVFKISASGTAPSGITSYLKIGWFYNEAAGSLSIASKFLGNYKSKTDALNCTQALSTVAQNGINSTSVWTNASGLTTQFVSSGRPLLLEFQGTALSASGGVVGVHSVFQRNETVLSDSDLIQGGAGEGYYQGLNNKYVYEAAAGTHSFGVEVKIQTSAYINLTIKRFTITEL